MLGERPPVWNFSQQRRKGIAPAQSHFNVLRVLVSRSKRSFETLLKKIWNTDRFQFFHGVLNSKGCFFSLRLNLNLWPQNFEVKSFSRQVFTTCWALNTVTIPRADICKFQVSARNSARVSQAAPKRTRMASSSRLDFPSLPVHQRMS
uniref:Uncharacterized protein n=1 Tax=Molossus molossus TaxID=27622 RepID=A0A7J8FZ34_MOLMO|nr:hypothetical protein HJG59_008263 [Molossus molossus]